MENRAGSVRHRPKCVNLCRRTSSFRDAGHDLHGYWGPGDVNTSNRHFFVNSGDGRRMRNLLLFSETIMSETIMDERHPAVENSSPLEPFIDRFAKELVQERIDSGQTVRVR